MSLVWVLQGLLALHGIQGPVRFGLPLAQRVVAQGVELRGPGSLSLRPLPLLQQPGLQWVEVALCAPGPSAVVQVRRGTPLPHTAPTSIARSEITLAEAHAITTWTFADGTVDRRECIRFAQPTEVDGERFDGGEARTCESAGLADRCRAAVQVPRSTWVAAGILPPDQGLAGDYRRWLHERVRELRELPGVRGAGDYPRHDGGVTNLEFDLPLGLLRMALAMRDDALLVRARRSARHLLDRDLDPSSGLPFAHGPDHRVTPPEPGHAWLTGLLWVGAVTADDDLLTGAQSLARAIAAHPPAGDGARERARDFAWPLLELESYLQCTRDEIVARAADGLAAAIASRYEPGLSTFRFGEGELGGGRYLERAWLTAGIVLPALQAHLRRRPDRELARRVARVTDTILDHIGSGRPGLPTHWHAVRGGSFGEARAEHTPEAAWLLECAPREDLQRLLDRSLVHAALQELPPRDHPDLPTAWAMVARCTWVYR